MNFSITACLKRVNGAAARLRYGVAALLGLLTVLAFAPFGWVVMPLLTLAAWGILLSRALSLKEAAWLGFAWGCGFFGLGVQWVYTTVHVVGGMPSLLAIFMHLLFAVYLSCFPAFVGASLFKCQQYLRCQNGYTRLAYWSVCFPLVWVVSELLRGEGELGFNWLTLGYSHAGVTPLVGWAQWLGVYGVSFWIVSGAGWLVVIYTEIEQALFKWSRILQCIAYFALILSLGAWSLRYPWTTPSVSLSVSLVQGNVVQSSKWDSAFQVEIFKRYTRLLNEAKGQLVVLPETAIPVLKHQLPWWWIDELEKVYRRAKRTALLGMVQQDMPSAGNDGGSYYNTLWSYGADSGQMYQKRHLVPLGEYIPGAEWLSFFSRWWEMPLAAFSRGEVNPPLLKLSSGVTIASTICYEDSFSRLLAGRFAEASLLLNISNDAWFGEGVAIDQHLQIAQMRSIETGKPMIRANNTAGTAVIDSTGHIIASLKPFQEEILEVSVQTRQGSTPFVRHRYLGLLILGGLSLLCVGWSLRKVNS